MTKEREMRSIDFNKTADQHIAALKQTVLNTTLNLHNNNNNKTSSRSMDDCRFAFPTTYPHNYVIQREKNKCTDITQQAECRNKKKNCLLGRYQGISMRTADELDTL